MPVIGQRVFAMLLNRLVRGTAAFCALLFAASCSSPALAQVSLPDGAPPWAGDAVNLEYHPIDGVSRIAYVSTAGNDTTGDVYTFAAANGDPRKKPAAIDPFLTPDAAIAAVGREGAHAVLLAAGQTHTSIITSGGCEGASAAHPYLIGVYWPSGTIPATATEQLAIIDPGLENASAGIVATLAEDAWLPAGDAYELAVDATIESVTVDNVSTYLVEGTFDALDAGQWAYDDPNNTLQVRLAGDVSPTGQDIYIRNRTGEENMVTVQRGSGISNLIIEGLYLRLGHRLVGDLSYDELAAQDAANNWGGIRIYGGDQENICIRGCKVEATSEGIRVEATGYDPANQLRNVVIDSTIVHNVWNTSGTYEGVFLYGLYRPRLLSSNIIANGWNYYNPTIGPGDTAQARCQGVYFSFVEDPWIDNCIVALSSNEGLQLRCGGYVTRFFGWANAGSVAWGHGQNEYGTALQRWTYTCKGRDIAVWGTKPVGGTNTNGRGIGWGLCDDLDLQRFVIVGEDTYRASGDTYALSIGTTSATAGRATSMKIAAGAVFDWNTTGATSSASFEFHRSVPANGLVHSESVTGIPVTMLGNRACEFRGNVWRSSGTETSTRNRIQAATLMANRYELGGTATLYGPSGTTPSKITSGGRSDYGQRPMWTAAPALHTFLSYSSEAALVEALVAPRTWTGQKITNKLFPLWRFNPVPARNPSAPNVPATGVGS